MRSGSPILSFLNAEPAFLLDEVEEHDLPHELLGKVGGPNVFLVELFRDRRIFPGELFESLLNFVEQRRRIS